MTPEQQAVLEQLGLQGWTILSEVPATRKEKGTDENNNSVERIVEIPNEFVWTITDGQGRTRTMTVRAQTTRPTARFPHPTGQAPPPRVTGYEVIDGPADAAPPKSPAGSTPPTHKYLEDGKTPNPNYSVEADRKAAKGTERPNVKDGYFVTEVADGFGGWTIKDVGELAVPEEEGESGPQEGDTRPNVNSGYAIQEVYRGGAWVVDPSVPPTKYIPDDPKDPTLVSDQQGNKYIWDEKTGTYKPAPGLPSAPPTIVTGQTGPSILTQGPEGFTAVDNPAYTNLLTQAFQDTWDAISYVQGLIEQGIMTPTEAQGYADAMQKNLQALMRGAPSAYQEQQDRENMRLDRAQLGRDVLNNRVTQGTSLASSLMGAIKPTGVEGFDFSRVDPFGFAAQYTTALGGGPEVSDTARALILALTGESTPQQTPMQQPAGAPPAIPRHEAATPSPPAAPGGGFGATATPILTRPDGSSTGTGFGVQPLPTEIVARALGLAA